MRRKGSGMSARHIVSDAFVFILLGVFALFSVLLVLVGTQGYRLIVDSAENHSDARILLGYTVNKVRMNDKTGVIRIEDDRIVIGQDFEGELYNTYIYCADGALRELFISAEDPFCPEDGEYLCPAQAMSVELAGNLLTICVTDSDGLEYAMAIALRCPAGGEADD